MPAPHVREINRRRRADAMKIENSPQKQTWGSVAEVAPSFSRISFPVLQSVVGPSFAECVPSRQAE